MTLHNKNIQGLLTALDEHVKPEAQHLSSIKSGFEWLNEILETSPIGRGAPGEIVNLDALWGVSFSLPLAGTPLASALQATTPPISALHAVKKHIDVGFHHEAPQWELIKAACKKTYVLGDRISLAAGGSKEFWADARVHDFMHTLGLRTTDYIAQASNALHTHLATSAGPPQLFDSLLLDSLKELERISIDVIKRQGGTTPPSHADRSGNLNAPGSGIRNGKDASRPVDGHSTTQGDRREVAANLRSPGVAPPATASARKASNSRAKRTSYNRRQGRGR
ncbi:hypothetical protein OG339_47440 (plasmid) [Streptosporangium sp. NBC_01495]|uniref:hypothetical protein n=1 Tax=Streptosporangium sp. NBC_01495 TaxID=2903899 RepID=UPI002E367D57|nr:hypothetical protein [Streptosporangium sp. NBC_01495]